MSISDLFENKIGKRTSRFLLLALGAVLTGLTLVYPKLGIIEWVSMIPAALALISICSDGRVRRRGLYGYGFFYFMCFYLVNYHWFINLYPLDFIDGMTKGAAVAVVLAGWVGLSLLQSLTGGLVFVLFGECVRGTVTKRFPPLGALFAAALWAIFEWTQTLGWVGVPWGRLSIGQTEWLLGAQSASIFGSCFVTFLIVGVNFLCAYSILYAPKRRLLAALAAGVFLCNTAFGAVACLTYRDEGAPVKVAVVQGNISSQEKWDSALSDKTYEAYEKYTAEAAEQGAQIVVWPESAMTYNIEDYTHVENFVCRLAKENGVTILVGTFTYNEDGGELNSIVAALPDGTLHETVYAKRHLVPFGEYVPLRPLVEVIFPPLANISMLADDLAAGEGAQIIRLDEADVGSLICFDSIYDELARDSTLSGAEILAISTNDSWFLDSAALYMHNAQAKLRAIENGRYVARSANTGVSSVITPTGKVVDSLAALTEGQITAEVYVRESHTPYTYLGNTFVYLCIIFMIVWLAYEKICSHIYRKWLTNGVKSDKINM